MIKDEVNKCGVKLKPRSAVLQKVTHLIKLAEVR